MSDMNVGQIRKILCRKCKINTNHVLLYKKDWSEPILEIDDDVVYENRVFQCCGCDSICLSLGSGLGNERDPQSGDLEIIDKFFPDPFITRERLSGYHHFPDNIKTIYDEIRIALNFKLVILTAMGLASLIEAICDSQNIVDGNLKKKINSLVKIGALTQEEAKLLHTVREYRNASTHELKKMTQKQLQLSMDLVESILTNLFILPKEFRNFDEPY